MMESFVIHLGLEPQKVISYSKNMMFPAMILGVFCVYFFSMQEYREELYQWFHTLFISTVIISLLVSVYMRITSSFICISLIYISYVIINSMRYAYGEDYLFSSGYFR